MTKIAIIGAGSVVFSRNITGDILSFPAFRDAQFTYMDIDEDRLNVGISLCRRIARGLGATPEIKGTLDMRDAISGADFVINMVQIGGFDSTLVDFEIPRKYGVHFTIADTTGPGGIFRALRTFPMLRDLGRAMEELCPDAVLINYSNPMSMNMKSITRTSSIRSVGLCHSVQGTFNGLMKYLDIEPEDANFVAAGLNHMDFYLRLEKDGEDLYPRLFEAMNDPKIYNTNKVRFELMKRLGYFVTESSEHSAEYSAFFMPKGQAMIDRLGIPVDEYLFRCGGIVERFEKLREEAEDESPLEHKRSREYVGIIVNSMVTGEPSVIYGNMPNDGIVSNLPAHAIVEAPTLVDRNGLQQTAIGDLPLQLTGYLMPHAIQHELFILGALEGRRDYIYQACMNDPLTAATLTLDDIVSMCDELIETHGALLPPLDKTERVPFSGRSFRITGGAALRERWEREHANAFLTNDLLVRDWRIALPQPSAAADIEATYTQDARLDTDAVSADFRPAPADRLGYLDITARGSAEEVAYAYAELDTDEHPRLGECPRDISLKCASTSPVTVWLNGEKVYEFDGKRDWEHADRTTVRLEKGCNSILVKAPAASPRWGFGIAFPKLTD
mgnify:FL=1